MVVEYCDILWIDDTVLHDHYRQVCLSQATAMLVLDRWGRLLPGEPNRKGTESGLAWGVMPPRYLERLDRRKQDAMLQQLMISNTGLVIFF